MAATRELLGLTQEAAAARAGMDTSRWKYLEQKYGLALPGDKPLQPSFTTVRRVGRALCASITVDFPYAKTELTRYTVRFDSAALTICNGR